MADRAEGNPRKSEDMRAARLQQTYAAIEELLASSGIGRWFLAEHARRNRSADTQALLDAIAKLKLAAARPRRRREDDRLLDDLLEMRKAIERTRREIAAIRPPFHLAAATEELDDIVAATEKATSEILQAAEEIQEMGWMLREKGADPELCETLDRRAADIYTACSFQDITGQRTGKVVKVLRFIEDRLNAMIEILSVEEIGLRLGALEGGATRTGGLLDGPQRQGSGLGQIDIDAMLGFADRPAPEGMTAPQAAERPGSGCSTAAGGAAVAGPSETFLTSPLNLEALDPIKRQTLFS